MPLTTAINNCIVCSPDNDFRPIRASIGIAEDRIAYLAAKPLGPADAQERIDGSSLVVMPGLVNGHCHGDMTVARGLGDGLTLQQQNEAFRDHGWFSRWLTDEDLAISRQATYIESLLNGTTFILENSFWNNPDAVTAMDQVGIRGAIAMDVRPDFLDPQKLVSLPELEQFIADCQEAGIVPVVGSISEEDFSIELLGRISELMNQTGIRTTSHLTETTWRYDKVMAELGMSPIQAMAKYGYFDHRHLGSHVVHLDQADIDTLAQRQVQVINTPSAEMKIADGIAPIPQLIAAGVNVSLGSDGALWNNANDIFAEMRSMLLLHSLNTGPAALSASQLLEMATINGYQAFGMDELGSIEVGKVADFICIDFAIPQLQPINLGPAENLRSALVSLVTGRDVSDVFIAGQRVVAQGAIQTINQAEVMEKLQAAHNKISAAIGRN